MNARYRDGRLPKNKDPIKFVEEIQEARRTKTYLEKKQLIRSTHE